MILTAGLILLIACPFLGGVLAWHSAGGAGVVGSLLFAVVSSGLGVVLIFVGLFTG